MFFSTDFAHVLPVVTVIFSVCGVNISTLILAIGLSLPRHLLFVYIGTALQKEGISKLFTFL